MHGTPNLSETIKIISDPTRIELLTTMIDKRYYTVTELSKRTGVSLSTTSYHLNKISTMGWIDSYKQGKNVYYGLNNGSIAYIIELLMTLSTPKKIKSYNQKKEYLEIKKARTCYSHLAGKFGVNLFDFMIENHYLEKEFHEVFLTKEGLVFLKNIGVQDPECLKGKLCMDWSERRFHLAGPLGSELCSIFLQQNWITKSIENRSVFLTAASPKWLRTIYEDKKSN